MVLLGEPEKYGSYKNYKAPNLKLCGDDLLAEKERSYSQLLSLMSNRNLTNGERRYLYELETELLKVGFIKLRHIGFKVTYFKIRNLVGLQISEVK